METDSDHPRTFFALWLSQPEFHCYYWFCEDLNSRIIIESGFRDHTGQLAKALAKITARFTAVVCMVKLRAELFYIAGCFEQSDYTSIPNHYLQNEIASNRLQPSPGGKALCGKNVL
ncbi:MAG: hypothetical protein ABR572_09220 [Cryomorphaceae bacterium]